MTTGDGPRCPFNASGAINFGPRTDSRRVASSSGQVSPGGGSYGIVTSRSQSHELLSFADCSKLATRSRMQTRVTMRRYGSCNRTRTESSPQERGPVCALSALSIPSHEATDDAVLSGTCLFWIRMHNLGMLGKHASRQCAPGPDPRSRSTNTSHSQR